MNIVIDTNILFSAIIRDSLTRHLIISLSAIFYYPEESLDEIIRNKEEVIKKAGISEMGFNQILATLFKYIRIVKKSETTEHLSKAEKLMGAIHQNDIVFIASAMAKDAMIWSNDEHFKKQKIIRAVTTKEILSVM